MSCVDIADPPPPERPRSSNGIACIRFICQEISKARTLGTGNGQRNLKVVIPGDLALYYELVQGFTTSLAVQEAARRKEQGRPAKRQCTVELQSTRSDCGKLGEQPNRRVKSQF